MLVCLKSLKAARIVLPSARKSGTGTALSLSREEALGNSIMKENGKSQAGRNSRNGVPHGGVNEAALTERLREATERGRRLGLPEFVEEMEHPLGRSVRPRRRGQNPRRYRAAIACVNSAMECPSPDLPAFTDAVCQAPDYV
jgi:hypothetical protein